MHVDHAYGVHGYKMTTKQNRKQGSRLLTRIELDQYFEKVVEFLDGRDLFKIPREEIWAFIGMHEKRSTFPAVAAIRVACMFELNRMRTDSSYRNSVEERILRNLWYQVSKPFLNRVEKPEHILQAKWGRRRSQKLSSVLSEMVLSGMCKYIDFNIVDRSRLKRRPGIWSKLKVGSFDEVIIFIEKQTQFPRIEVLADLLGFTVECGSGQQATAAIEGLIDSLKLGTNYLVFVITDFDYYGHVIAESMIERVEKLGITAEFHRTGVNVDQVSVDKIEVAKFLIPRESQKEKDWADKYAIEGRYGLEIEALSAKELRKTIATAVYQYCDPDALYEHLKKQALEGILNKVYSDVVNDMTSKDKNTQDMRKEISKLREKIDTIEKTICETVDPLARQIVKEKTEELDDREDFPHEWLEEQIIEGKPSLSHSEYTGTNDIKERLVSLLKDAVKDQVVEAAFSWLFEDAEVDGPEI